MRKHIPLLISAFFVLVTNGLFGQTYSKFNGTLNTSFGSASPNRYQLIYLPSDIENAPTTNVKAIYFRFNGIPSATTITNFQVKLGWVSATTFPGNGTTFFTNLTPVVDRSTYITPTNGSQFYMPIEPAFTYQAGKTLVVEVSYSSGAPNLPVRYSTGPTAPNHKRLDASFSNPNIGNPSQNWLDFAFDPGEGESAPANDLCTNAQVLSLNTNCQQTSGHTVYATQNLPPAFCGGFSSSAAKDVYYSFTANTATDSFFVQGLGGFDPVLQIYSGTCGSLSNVRCSYTPNDNNIEKISPGNLVPGQKYFLRVYGKDGSDGSFTLCGKSPNLLVPSNDNCQNAVLLSLSTVCAGNLGTNSGATESSPAIACNGNTSSTANDVWYKFEAVNAYDSVVVISNGFINPVVELYSGTCSNLNTISCSDNPSNPLAKERVSTGDLIPGNIYYVRVYGFGNTNGTFTICAKTPPVNVPANDEVCDGISLVINPDCNPQTFSNVGATETFPPVNCQPGGQSSSAADVWFKFTFQSIYDTILVSPVGGFNPVVEMYTSVVTCLGVNSFSCSDGVEPSATERISTFGTGTNTVYVRVYGFNGTVGSFNICIRKGDPSVLFDNCANALAINVAQSVCSPRTGRTNQATPTPGLTSCKGNPDDDVWYKFGPIGASNIVFRLTCDPGFDGAMEIFSGACGNLTRLACINRMGAGFQEDTLLSFVNTPNIYYIRVYHAGVGPGVGNFSLCVNSNPIPSNDNCTNGTLLQSGLNLCSQVSSSNYGAAQANAPISCGGRTSSTARDVWYWFSATSATMEIYVKPKGGMDPVIQLFRGSCSSLTDRDCKDDSLAGKGERLIVTGLTVGTSYNFRVYSNSQFAVFGDFAVCVKNGTFCQTQPGIASVDKSSTGNNGRVVLNLAGQTAGANVQWQVSYNGGGQYNNFGPSDAILPDTLSLSVASTQNVLVRALVSAPNCNSSTTPAKIILVKCATAFENPVSASSGNYISAFSLNTLTSTSSPQWVNGGYETLTTNTTVLCSGSKYQVSISHVPADSALTRVMWMDLNKDGDFSDPNELIIPPNTGIGTLSQLITIPASTTGEGSMNVRVMVYDAGLSTPSADPCFAGPYLSGEIEEYAVVMLKSIIAQAGPDRIICGGGVNLAGSSPSPGSGVWSVVSGPAQVVSSGNANSPVVGIGFIPSVLVWRVTSSGCVSTDTLTLRREAKTLNLGNDTTICENDSITLRAGNDYVSYIWVNGSALPTFKIFNPGSYWVQVTSQNGCIFRDTIKVSICVSNAKILENESKIEIYPNPSSGDFMLKLKQAGTYKIRIFDNVGKVVKEQVLDSGIENQELPIQLQKPISGIYWLEIENAKTRTHGRIMVE